MNLSVIVSTYNSPRWLEKVLCGYAQQTYRDFELIVADDGSGDDTRELINRISRDTDLNMHHVWQQDRGFRKCRILNKAILKARHDYLVFSDGDCIPRKDFLEVHANAAEPGRYLSGSYIKLPMHTSETICEDDIVSGRCFESTWLRQHGMGRTRKQLALSAGRRAARLLNTLTTTRCNFKGSNASAWKTDVLAVNGFDERMHWGGEDREFGVRLVNNGIRPKHVRYDAIVLHLDHARSYVDPDRVKSNRELRIHNQKYGIRQTQYGISALPESHSNGQSLDEPRSNAPG